MRKQNQAIKWIAIGFATFLSIIIFTALIGGVASLVYFMGDDKGEFDGMFSTKTISFTKDFDNVTALDISGGSFPVEIVPGDSFSVVAENIPEEYEASISNGTLRFSRSSGFYFHFFSADLIDAHVTIYYPADVVLEEVMVDGGSGKLFMEGIRTKRMKLDLGSGSTKITDIDSESTDICTGSGQTSIEMSSLGTLLADSGSGQVLYQNVKCKEIEMNTGSGRVNYTGTMEGKSNFDSGSGRLVIRVQGEKEDYNLTGSSGSGGVYIGGSKMEDSFQIRSASANNSICVNGGSGNVSVDFE